MNKLRDMIALEVLTHALQALTENIIHNKPLPRHLQGVSASVLQRELAEGSYAMADAMMRARGNED